MSCCPFDFYKFDNANIFDLLLGIFGTGHSIDYFCMVQNDKKTYLGNVLYLMWNVSPSKTTSSAFPFPYALAVSARSKLHT